MARNIVPLDPMIRVKIVIPKPSEETIKLLEQNPRLATLHRLLELQAILLAGGTEDASLVAEMGKLYAQHYREINTRDLPNACEPLYEALRALHETYGKEIACRIFVERTMKIGESFAREFLRDELSKKMTS